MNLDFEGYKAYAEKKYKYLASGSYGSVYELNDKEVIKVGISSRDKYILYVKAVGLNSANVHLPKIYDIETYKTSIPYQKGLWDYHVVRMEKLMGIYELEKILMKLYGTQETGVWNEFSNYWTSRGLPLGFRGLDSYCIGNANPTTADLLEVKNILKEMYNKHKAVSDLGLTNVLWRYDSATHNYDAVFTDPIA